MKIVPFGVRTALGIALAVSSTVTNVYAAPDGGATQANPESHSADTKSVHSESSHTKSHGEQNFGGHAHYYGKGFHGKRTASGAVFDKEKMTAAHPTLAFGTKVRVRSTHTGKEVVVTITDRCPHMKQRCIDLSEGAARKIGLYPSAPSGVECVVLKK